jgi:hypothetical protein
MPKAPKDLADRPEEREPMAVLAEVESTDVLTDVLASLRLRGRLFCRSELSSPWSLSLPAGDDAHFHVVERGGCWIRVARDDRPKPLAGGGPVMLPHGRPGVDASLKTQVIFLLFGEGVTEKQGLQQALR